MKKILLLLFLFAFGHTSHGQFNASQIKKDGVTIKGNTSNQLMVDTSNVATKLYVQNQVSGGGSSAWGSITGTLSNQTDLQSALNAKLSLSDTASMLTRYLRSNSATLLYYPLSSNPSSYLVAADIAGKLNISDTAAMLNRYLLTNTASGIYATITNLGLKLAIADTASMLTNYLRSATASGTYATISNLALKVAYTDTATMLSPYLRSAAASTTYVPQSTTVNGHALSGNVTVTSTDLGLGNVENTAISTWSGSGNITTLGTITSGAAMQEGAEASITNNSGASNDTQVPTTTCRFYNFFTLPSTGKLYMITGIEWKNGTVVAGNVVCGIQSVDANPPTLAGVVLLGLTQTVAASGTSSVQRVSVLSCNIIRGGALIAVFIQGASATQRFMTATVGSANVRKNVSPTANVENAETSAWVAYTEQAYCKIYYREYK